MPQEDHPSQPSTVLGDGDWRSPWRGFISAFRLRSSFGVALGYGGLALLVSLGLSIFGGLLSLTPLAFFTYVVFGFGSAILIPFFVCFFLVLFLTSRLIDPEIRIWGGFQNLRIGWAIGCSFGLGVYFILASGGIFAMLNFTPAGLMPDVLLWVVTGLVGTIFAFGFQVLSLCCLRQCLLWSALRNDTRIPLPVLFRQPTFMVNQVFLGSALWALWLSMTIASIFMSIGLAMWGVWPLMFVFIPFSALLIGGYAMLVFASVFAATFRSIGWTLGTSESLSSVFD